MKFGIVLRNHNAFDLTSECLNSLLSLTYSNKTIIVLNDGCGDDSPKKLKKAFPSVIFIDLEKYLEYTRSLNIGIRRALSIGCDAVFIVNNDTKNFSPNYLEVIENKFQDPKAGLVGSLVKDYDGQWLWNGNFKDKLGVPMNTPTEGYVIRKEVFEKIGLLSERYYRYFEDLDFLLRLRAAGFETQSASEISFDHLCNGTSSKQVFVPNYYRIRNFFWFIKKECRTKSFKWKLNKFYHALTYHGEKIVMWLRRGKPVKAIGVILCVLAGCIVGATTSFGTEHQNTFKLGD